jgi:hypothetical protein
MTGLPAMQDFCTWLSFIIFHAAINQWEMSQVLFLFPFRASMVSKWKFVGCATIFEIILTRCRSTVSDCEDFDDAGVEG